MSSHEHATGATPSRRSALKLGAAAVAGAVVWAEPTIKGLVSRPAYAQACSTAPIVALYQPDDPNVTRNGVSVDTNHNDFTGNGFANFPGTGSITYQNVDGNCGGPATVSIRYALAGGSRTGSIDVNGTVMPITFTGTGGWSNWQFLSVPITLLAGGSNIVTISSTGSDLSNQDYIEITTS